MRNTFGWDGNFVLLGLVPQTEGIVEPFLLGQQQGFHFLAFGRVLGIFGEV